MQAVRTPHAHAAWGADTRDPSFCGSSSQGKIFAKTQPADLLSHVIGPEVGHTAMPKTPAGHGNRMIIFCLSQPRLYPELSHCPTCPRCNPRSPAAFQLSRLFTLPAPASVLVFLLSSRPGHLEERGPVIL